ncbi:MAG: hypothetical protein JWP89_1586 [Schlesneria sp.]|nr:hypothetical protein [Schlesneria sp.]
MTRSSRLQRAPSSRVLRATEYGSISPTRYSARRRTTELHRCYVNGIARDWRDSKLKEAHKTPEFYILGTDFSTGRLVSFSRNGISLLASMTMERLGVSSS